MAGLTLHFGGSMYSKSFPSIASVASSTLQALADKNTSAENTIFFSCTTEMWLVHPVFQTLIQLTVFNAAVRTYIIYSYSGIFLVAVACSSIFCEQQVSRHHQQQVVVQMSDTPL